MDRREFIILASATVGLAVMSACGAGDTGGAAAIDPNVEPEIIEWSIGPKGGLGQGGAFITQASWEPKRVDVPLGRPFKIRFMPRDQRFHPIVFGTSLKEEVGVDLPTLEIRDGQPAETPVMVINSPGKAFDVFCREHRGVNGFGSIITPS
ncbi:MAG: hypothetical protein ACE5Q6_01625 [Dehalococcoidia bacterium]